jgi:hypothetical protein
LEKKDAVLMRKSGRELPLFSTGGVNVSYLDEEEGEGRRREGAK